MSGGPVTLETLKVAQYGPGKPGSALAQELDMDIDINRIAIGRDPPVEVNLIVEIPQGGAPVKYEIDTASGALRVGRFCVYTGTGRDRDLEPRLHGHFFGRCKDLEDGEWIELVRWADAKEVEDLLRAAIARAEATATP
jgi:inorganic pyrophosphatase